MTQTYNDESNKMCPSYLSSAFCWDERPLVHECQGVHNNFVEAPLGTPLAKDSGVRVMPAKQPAWKQAFQKTQMDHREWWALPCLPQITHDKIQKPSTSHQQQNGFAKPWHIHKVEYSVVR